MSKSNLFAEFPETSKADWLAKVEKDLKGKSVGSLDWHLSDNLVVSPFAHADDLKEDYAPMAGNRESNDWEIGEMIHVSDVKSANEQALKAINYGANAIGFVLGNEPAKVELIKLFSDINHENISTHFFTQFQFSTSFFNSFLTVIQNKNQDPKKISGSFQFQTGDSQDTDYQWFLKIKDLFPKFPFLTVNAHPFYKGTRNTVEELAHIITTGNGFLGQLTDENVGVKEINDRLLFSLLIGESYFVNIAKIRVLKLLWNQILNAYDPDLHALPNIEAHLAPKSQTEDQNFNMIKATTQAMSAIIGGIERLFVLPADAFEKKTGTAFSRRIARNLNHILKMESYFDRVIDPAAGSYYIENLTDILAEEAWKLFQKKSEKRIE